MPISLPGPSRAHCDPYLSVGSAGVAAKSLDLLQSGSGNHCVAAKSLDLLQSGSGNHCFAAKRAILLQKFCGGKTDGRGDGRTCQPHLQRNG